MRDKSFFSESDFLLLREALLCLHRSRGGAPSSLRNENGADDVAVFEERDFGLKDIERLIKKLG